MSFSNSLHVFYPQEYKSWQEPLVTPGFSSNEESSEDNFLTNFFESAANSSQWPLQTQANITLEEFSVEPMGFFKPTKWYQKIFWCCTCSNTSDYEV